MATWNDISAPVFNIEFDYDIGVSSLTADFSNLMGADDPSLSVAIPWRDCWAEIMDLVPETGGQVVWLDGEYVYSKTMEITRNNLHISGMGESTIFSLADNVNSTVRGFMAVNKSGVKITDLAMNGNKENQTISSSNAVTLQYCKDFEIKSVDVKNFTGSAIVLTDSSDGNVSSCKFANISRGVQASNVRRISISDNVINEYYYTGIQVTDNSLECVIEANRVTDGDPSRSVHSIRLIDSSNNTIANNVCSRNESFGSLGIALMGGCVENTITGNVLEANGHYGMQVSGDHNNVSSNVFTRNKDIGMTIFGDFNNVQHNKFYDNGGYPVFISGTRNVVTNNDLYGNGEDGLLDAGVDTITNPGNRE